MKEKYGDSEKGGQIPTATETQRRGSDLGETREMGTDPERTGPGGGRNRGSERDGSRRRAEMERWSYT